jgi:hypothetical protein
MTNLSRVDLVVIIIFATIGLIIPLVVATRHFFDIDPLALLHITWGRTVLGIIFTFLATVVCLFNFMQSIIEPWLYKRKHGSMKDFGSMSGLPLIGGFFILFAGALMPPSVLLGSYLLLLYLIDGNGFPMVFIGIIREGV